MTSDTILANTQTFGVEKCFNTTGYDNTQDPVYENITIDAYVVGDREKSKERAVQLAKEIGFAECYYIGGNDKLSLLE